MSEPLPPAMFLTDGDGFVGTALARGPWDEGAAHGGPVAALIGRAVERYDPDPTLVTVRYTIELLRPVPLAGIVVRTTTVRPGRRVRLDEAELSDSFDNPIDAEPGDDVDVSVDSVTGAVAGAKDRFRR